MFPRLFGGLALALLTLASPVFAGDNDYEMRLSLETGSVLNGSSDIDLSFALGAPVRGWSIGICADIGDDLLTPTTVTPSMLIDTIDGGSPPFFQAINLVGDRQVSIGALISTDDAVVLGPIAESVAYTISYDFDPPATVSLPALEQVRFCTLTGDLNGDTITDPAVETFFAVTGGTEAPITFDGGITVIEPNAFRYTFAAVGETIENVDEALMCDSDENVCYLAPCDPSEGDPACDTTFDSYSLQFCVEARIQEIEGVANSFPTDTQGFSMGMEFDDAAVDVVSVEATGALADINGGTGPGFFSASFPVQTTGITLGCLYNLTGGVFLSFEDTTSVVKVTLDTLPGYLDGSEGQSIRMEWNNNFGLPPIENEVVVTGTDFEAELVNLDIIFVPVFDLIVDYIRGDCNDDGLTDISDGVFLLNALFDGGPEGTCFSACDINSDGLNDQSDAIFMFNYQFLEGPPPPSPFPLCGKVGDPPFNGGAPVGFPGEFVEICDEQSSCE